MERPVIGSRANPLASLNDEQLSALDPDAVESIRVPMRFTPPGVRVEWDGEFGPGLSDGLFELASFGIDAALENIRDGSSLVPFLLEHAAETTLQLWMADTLEESVALACAAAGRLDVSVSAYVIVYDGYITVDGERHDAVYAEAAERGAETGFLVAQRYKPKKGLLSRLTKTGAPGVVERVRSRFL